MLCRCKQMLGSSRGAELSSMKGTPKLSMSKGNGVPSMGMKVLSLERHSRVGTAFSRDSEMLSYFRRKLRPKDTHKCMI